MKTGRITRALTSRMLAVWLLLALAAWSVVGTVVDGVFSSPVFATAFALLAVATGLCAWERTTASVREWRRRGVSPSERERLSRAPHLRLAPGRIPGGGPIELSTVARRLRRAGMSTSVDDGVCEATGGRWGLLGSPVFHWSLALLFVVIAAGRLSRAEGWVQVPEGGSVPNAAESWVGTEYGPLFAGFTDVDIALKSIERDYRAGGVDRGIVPVVSVTRGDVPLREQPVHPNGPLRYGALTVHDDEVGVYAVVRLFARGADVDESTLFFDVGEGMRTAPAEFGLVDASGAEVLVVTASGLLDREEPTVELTVVDPVNGESVAEGELREGEKLDIEDQGTIAFADSGSYARLAVVQDWSLPWMYGLFVIGTAGLSVAVLNPYRRVVAELVGTPEGPEVRVLARHTRGSALFRERVRAALEIEEVL